VKITEPTPNAPCWVELGTKDPDAAKSFYHELFGWRAETDPRSEGMGYTFMYVGEAAVAAITPLFTPEQPTAWTISFATTDADGSAEAIRAGGGTLIVEPMDALDMGRFVVAADPSGAIFSVWQAASFPGAGLLNEPGALGWVELATRDTALAKEFYSRVLGWSVTTGEMYTQWGTGGKDFGGMLDMTDQFPADIEPYWMPYFAVADVDTSAERAALLGATVTLPPTDVPDGPRLAVLRDPQGAVFGIHVAGTEG